MHYPRHIGIIPDGNRTRAKERDLPSIFGHKAGFERAKELVKYTLGQTPIEVITLRGASTENIIERSPEELDYLYDIYQTIDDDMKEFYEQNGIGYKRIGSEVGLPDKLIQFFREQEKKYPSRDGKYMIIAVNYGGRDEILRGINTYISSHPNQAITESQLSDSMDLGAFPPIELVIRSKGDVAKRISGFMSRWIGYAELYFFNGYFPDFTVQACKEALSRFDSVVEHRNFGK